MSVSSKIYKGMIKALSKVVEGGSIPMPDKKEVIEADENAELNFIAWGDPQISFISPLRSARVYAACRDVDNARGRFDALFLLGDITEYGAECEYKTAAYLINGINDKIDKVFAVSGNHDIRLRNYKKQLYRFNCFLSSINGGVKGSDEHYCFSYDLKGYKLIFLGADRTCFEGTHISKRQLVWLEKELNEADGSKPVFVFNHQALKGTNGLPMTWLGRGKWRGTVGWDNDRLRAVLEKRKNVIYITGHLHYGISEYTYEDLGNIKAVSVPTVGVLNHGPCDKLSQGIVFSVYNDKIVGKSRVFGEGRYVEDSVSNSAFTIEL